MNYWLFKSEPNAYSYDDLVADSTAEWDGVRNFQARNYLRDSIKAGDLVLFYHSNAKPPCVVGTASVVRSGYPDYTAWDPRSDHPDPKSSPDNPIWYMVDIKADDQFRHIVGMEDLRQEPSLEQMVVLKKGNRLSITPVTESEFETVLRIGLTER